MWFFKLKVKAAKELERFWYFSMKPIAYFFTNEKIDKRYQKKVDRLSEQKAIKTLADALVKYAIKHNKVYPYTFIICEYAHPDYVGTDFTIDNFFTRGINKKVKLSKSKLRSKGYRFSIDTQLKIVEELKAYKEAEVKEYDVQYSDFDRVEGYVKTVDIEIKK